MSEKGATFSIVADLKENINNLTDKFGKKVIVAETAYLYTDDNADDTPNLIGEQQAEEGFAPGFGASIIGTANPFRLISARI